MEVSAVSEAGFINRRQPHGILKVFAKGRFARQLRYLLDPYPALGTAHPVQFDDHRGPILSPRQVAIRHGADWVETFSTFSVP
jgi:hypothetical protein